MEEIKSDSEIIAEIYRNAQLALTSIADILPEVEDFKIKEEILKQRDAYKCTRITEHQVDWTCYIIINTLNIQSKEKNFKATREKAREHIKS